MVQKIVTFDVALKSTERQWVQKIPEVYTNDLHSVSLQFRITDCTDTELTGSTAIVLLKMRDGSFFQGPSVDVSRTLNVFSYTLKENEGNHDGLAEIQLIVTINAKEFATQKYNFKVITGLDSEVAREIMIYDWSTLTAEARAYIDQFTADELLRDAEFDNNQFDRNVAFNLAQTNRQNQFSDLAEGLTATLAAADASIGEFDVALQNGIVAANLAEKLEDFESTNNSRLLSVESGLADKIGNGVKAEPEDLSATTLGLITGTGGPINLLSIPQDNSVSSAKIVDKSVSVDKLTDYYNARTTIDGSVGGDLNTILKSGVYHLTNSPQNIPAGFGATGIMTVDTIGARYALQSLSNLSDNRTSYVRVFDKDNSASSKWFSLSDNYKGFVDNGSDLNTYHNNGVYYVGNVLNKPIGVSGTYHILEVVSISSHTRTIQKLYNITKPHHVFYRTVKSSDNQEESKWSDGSKLINKYPYISSSRDFNACITNGRWMAIDGLNSPTTGVYTLEVEEYYTSDTDTKYWGVQRAINTDSTVKTFHRNFYVSSQGEKSFSPWVRMDNVPSGNDKLNGVKIVNFGDSIFGNDDRAEGVSGYMSTLASAESINVGFGGCAMSQQPGPYWDAFSMYRLADAITTRDFTLQDIAIANYTQFPDYFASRLERLKGIDFSTVEYVTIAYGTNDYTTGIELDNANNQEDTTTFNGALRYSLRKIYETYPHLKILVCTPTYRFFKNEDLSFKDDSDTVFYNSKSNTLPDFVASEIAVAREFKTPVVDNYNELGINKYNRLKYFSATDGVHHIVAGREKLARKILSALTSQF